MKAVITTWNQYKKRLAAISPLAFRIYKKIKQDPSSTPEEIGEYAGCNRLTVNSTIPTLLNEGLLIAEHGQLSAVVMSETRPVATPDDAGSADSEMKNVKVSDKEIVALNEIRRGLR